MLAAYFVTLGLLMICALHIKSAYSLAAVLTASWAASYASGLAGLGVLAPYIDGLAFYGLLVFTLKSPTTENVRCTWLSVAMVACHAVFTMAAVFVANWSVANALAVAYMWCLNGLFILQVMALIGGKNVKRVFGLALEGLGSLGRHPAGRRYAAVQMRQKVEP